MTDAGAERADAAAGPVAGQVRLGGPSGRWVILATVLGSGMAMLDGTAVNVALPTIGRQLSASLGGLQWIVSGYTLALAGLILLGGSLGDRMGRRRVFVTGVIWFALASALCGVAPSIAVLIAARVLQGIGGALLVPGSLAIIQASFAPRDRPRAIGAWSGLGGLAAAVGPLLGGWLVVTAGWRWVFLINLPVAAAVVAVALRHVPESRDERATRNFDVLGAGLAALALAGITFALISGPSASGRGLIAVIIAAVAGGGAAVAFILVERLRGRSTSDRVPAPMLPLDIFVSRQFTVINVITFCVYAAFGGELFLLVLELQVASRFSALAAGSALLPITVLMLVLSPRSAALAQRIGPRWPLTAGSALCAAGLLLATRIGVHASYLGDVLPAVVVFGFGLTLVVSPLTATVLASADVRHAGVASGVNNAVARAAGLLAVAGLPAAIGLHTSDYHSPVLLTHDFRLAMIVCAGLLVLAGALAVAFVDDRVLSGEPEEPAAERASRRICPVEAPQLGYREPSRAGEPS
ncbi:MAG TPA: MFS transporter [Streptosporangiaceae bacterium]|nr:MFS transporter [Streptosporangiaceae bacterium]